MNCTSAIRQIAYGSVPDSVDEYLQMGVTTSRSVSKCSVRPSWSYMVKSWPMNNDVNVLRQSILFNDLKAGKASDVPFMVNNVTYKRGYYLIEGIYPQWSVLIKSIKNPSANDHKRILYKTKHETSKKDVERAFGV
ncbi:ALP1-like protein [Tanacetum coccineum]